MRKFSKAANAPIRICIYGDIYIGNTTYKLKNEYESTCITLDRGVLIIDSDLFSNYLKTKLKLSDKNLVNFEWADNIRMNDIQIEFKNKKYTSRVIFFENILSEYFKLYNSTALNILYRSRGKIYTALFFKQDMQMYTEYLFVSKNSEFEKLTINQDSFKDLESRIKEMIILEATPNYETPTPISYIYQLGSLDKHSNFKFHLRGNV